MTYKEITIYTTTAGIDIVAGYLTMQGIRGVSIEDAEDFSEFLESTEIHWDYVEEDLMRLKTAETNVKFWVPDNLQGMETLRAIETGLSALREQNPAVDLGRLSMEVGQVEEEDWATAWKKYYHPTKVGTNLTVVPCWEEYDPAPGERVVTLDPGMAFGTGTHETTRLCMRQLEEVVTPGAQVLDVGTGSGILAITALLLGASHAVGVDIDEVAVKTAGENARLNGVEDRLELVAGDLTRKVTGQYDVICANIVADVILRLSRDVLRFLKPNGVLLCSGIIEERCGEIEAAFAEIGMQVCRREIENGWAALRLSRKEEAHI